MRSDTLRTLIAVCGAVLCLSGCVWRGDLVDSWETTNHTLKVRVRKFTENPPIFMQHTEFAFEAAPQGSDQWREVMTWEVDDAIPIQRQQVQFVGDRTTYAFGNWKFAVTVDGGHTWSLWDAKEKFHGAIWALIRHVNIPSDGTGTMELEYNTDPKRIEAAQLETTDFGVRWTTK